MRYRGQLIDKGAEFVMGLLFIGILVGAGVIASVALNATQTVNTTAWFVTNNATSSLVNYSVQLPTVGTIAGVSLIILVLFVGIGVYFMKSKEGA